LRNSRQSLRKYVEKYVEKYVAKSVDNYAGRYVDKRATSLVNTGAARTITRTDKALILACLMAPLAVMAADSALLPAINLRHEAAAATKKGQPLLILYSRQNCPYCEEVRTTWLNSLSHDTRHSGLQVRQIDQDSERPLIDFSGRVTTHARFAAAENVSFVPVVAVYGARGQRLAESIVGLRLRDFYGAYLDTQLDEARARLRTH
jgi:glutaredoxin